MDAIFLGLSVLKSQQTPQYCSGPSTLRTNEFGHPRYYRRQCDHHGYNSACRRHYDQGPMQEIGCYGSL